MTIENVPKVAAVCFWVNTTRALSAHISSSSRHQMWHEATGSRPEAVGPSVICAWVRTCHIVGGTAPRVSTQQRRHFLAVRWP